MRYGQKVCRSKFSPKKYKAAKFSWLFTDENLFNCDIVASVWYTSFSKSKSSPDEILFTVPISMLYGDFTLDGMEVECRVDIAFFRSCTCVKVLFTNTFLKYRFRWKVEIISTFPPRTNVAFFLSQSFLCIHVNKVSHYNMTYSQSTIQLKVKWLLANKFNMILDN